MASLHIPELEKRLSRLEAEYDQEEDRIDRGGGVDYSGELIRIQKEMKAVRHELELTRAMWKAVESKTTRQAAASIVEVLLADDDTETLQDLAYDFVEDLGHGIGRLDWITNWKLISSQGQALNRIQTYLNAYNIAADAQQLKDYVDSMTVNNPGRWK